MKKSIFSLAALVLSSALASAQVNTVPQVGVNTSNTRANTYSSTMWGLVPASSATDFWCMNGSATRNIHLRRLYISGTAGTAINTVVYLKLNHSLDTGGTAATGNAAPVIAPNNPNNPTSTVSASTAYTANPTVNDASPNQLVTFNVSFPTSSGLLVPTLVQAGSSVDFYDQSWDIPKATTVVQQLCLNLNAATISTGSLTVSAEWTED